MVTNPASTSPFIRSSSVFEGSSLHNNLPAISSTGARCYLPGTDERGAIRLPLSDDIFSKHILLLGGIGAGKTNAIFHLLSQLRLNMTDSDVMLIFDTKGDYYNEFYQPGDIVISNDAHATGGDKVDYWNIFNEIPRDETMGENAIEISRTLFYEKSLRSNQPFFPNAARDLLTAIFLHHLRSGDPSLTTNLQLSTFLHHSTASDIRQMLQGHDDLRAIVSYINDDRSPQTQGVISELQQMVREILIGNFCKAGSLSVRNAVRQKGGRVIFIEYDLGIGNTLTPIYRLLLDLSIKEALGRKKSEGNVWFVVDEFRLVPNLQHVDDGVNFGRSLGAKFIIGVQNVEQVFYAYSESMARSILSGFLTTIAFRVNDITTRNFVKDLFGKNRKRESYLSTVQARGLVEQVREANVVEDWDISGLPIGKAVIGLPGQEPFVFQFKKYQPKAV